MVATEQEIRAEAALRAIKLGSSVRAAAKRFAVPRSYLQRRIQGIPTRKEVNRDLQSLSPYLERQLSIWAIGQARLGYAPSLVKFQAIAQMMLRASGSSKVLGDKWYRHFLDRNPMVETARAQIIDYKRVDGATAHNINLFFDRMEVSEVASVPPDRYYNTDEMGVARGVGGDHFVIVETNTRKAIKKDVERSEWITALECISPSGVALPPLIIFKGVDVQLQWYPRRNLGLWDDWRFDSTLKGWTTNPTALAWMREVFIPHKIARHGNLWVVLVCDGHESHTTDEFLWLCLLNKVWLVFYEPHCSHVVQALDVGVFSLLKKKLKFYLRQSIAVALGQKPSKEDFLRAYRQARIDVLTPRVVKKAWRTTGIEPRDRQKALSSKYVMLEDVGIARARPDDPPADERPSTPQFLETVSNIQIATPSGGQELRNLSRKLATEHASLQTPKQRLLYRKASKALDLQTVRIAELERRVQFLKAKAVKKERQFRKKVKPSPGQRLITMANIRRARRRLRNRVLYEDEASDVDMPGSPSRAENSRPEDLTEAEDCIVVQNTKN